MLRQQILITWNDLKTKFTQLKAKSIDNYEIATKRAILGLTNYHSARSLSTLWDFMVVNGEVVNQSETKIKSKETVEICTELLKVAILERLDDDDTPLNQTFLKNHNLGVPTIEEV